MSPSQTRITEKIAVDAETGCWVWQGAKTAGGYGTLGEHGKTRYAHRYSYEAYLGPIPAGLQLDHLCRNRACANPAHLEPVTNRENALRGLKNVYATGKCSNDHIIADVGLAPSGQHMRCRECKREKDRRYKARRRAS